MKFKDWLRMRNACHESLEWLEDKTLQEAWEACQRGDWMRWLSQAATKVVGCNWTWNKHDQMCSAWTVFAKKEGIDAAYDEAIGKILLKDGLGNIKEEDEVWERYVSLQASFFRSIQPSPPAIPGLEN